MKEIYEAVCLDCREKIRALVKAKISDQMVDQILGVGQEAKGREG